MYKVSQSQEFFPAKRLGIGTLQLAGPNGWGALADTEEARRVLQSAVSHGIRVIDTAWYYGPDVVNELVADALFPYPDDLLLIGKLGSRRDPKTFAYLPSVTPDTLRQACDRTLRTLRVEAMPLLMLRWRPDLDDGEAFDQAWNVMLELQKHGKTRYVGLTNVTVNNIARASAMGKVAAVSNGYSVMDRSDEHILNFCDRNDIWFIPYYPLNRGGVETDAVVGRIAAHSGCTSSQVALAWLLARSPRMLPIPGTARWSHLQENLAAIELQLSRAQHDELSALGVRM